MAFTACGQRFETMLEFDLAVQEAMWNGFNRYRAWLKKRDKQYKEDLQKCITRLKTNTSLTQ